tara:strand:+ start:1103 stop:2323 length:1221 start_codon:yes stop_codon:yes gene_type:complete
MKIIFFASYPDLGIGYSRIANILSNFLAELGHDIYYIGISNFNNIENCSRNIHPNITLIDAAKEEIGNELYGVNVICKYIQQVKPDMVLIYNDIIVISRIFNNFTKLNIQKNFKLIVYLDLVYRYEKIDLIEHVDRFSDKIIVFSECWKQNLMEMGVSENKIDFLYHGIDKTIFFPVEKHIAREKLNLGRDDFIVLNSNRNNYRKCIDKTIDAFVLFLKRKQMNPKIKMFLNMNLHEGPTQPGYNIQNLIKISCIKHQLPYDTVVNHHFYRYPKDASMTDELLNYLYNACDIGMNTCMGEGFGLCNLEHGSLGKPQIISNVGGLSDIFNPDFSMPIQPISEIYVPNSLDYHGGYLEICSTLDFTNALIQYYDNPSLRENHGILSRKILNEKYDWSSILQSFAAKLS